MHALAYPKSKRLLNPASFARVFASVDCKQGGKYFTFLSCSSRQDYSRLGLIVAKRHCKRAVDRNRIKRCAREMFRLASPEIAKLDKQFDVIVIAKANAYQLSNHELGSELDRQWTKLLKKRQAID